MDYTEKLDKYLELVKEIRNSADDLITQIEVGDRKIEEIQSAKAKFVLSLINFEAYEQNIVREIAKTL